MAAGLSRLLSYRRRWGVTPDLSWRDVGSLADIAFGTPRLGATFTKIDVEVPFTESGGNTLSRVYVQVREQNAPATAFDVRDCMLQRVTVAADITQYGSQSAAYCVVPFLDPGTTYEVRARVESDDGDRAVVYLGTVATKADAIADAATLAPTHYVGTGGSDAAAGTAIGTQWANLSKALGSTTAGGVCVFGPGFYTATSTARASAGTFRAQYPSCDDDGNEINVGNQAVIEPPTVTAPTGTVAHSASISSNSYAVAGWTAVQLQGPGATTAPTGSGARLLAVLTTQAVTSVTVVAGGTGYTDGAAVVFFGGGGSGAAGTINVSGGVITSVTVSNGGSGYTSNPGCRVRGPVRWYGGDGVTPDGTLWKLGSVPNIDVNGLAQVGYGASRTDDPRKIGFTRVDTSVCAAVAGWAEILYTNQWYNDSGAFLSGTDLYVKLPSHARRADGALSRNPNDYWMKVGGDVVAGFDINANTVRVSGFKVHCTQYGVQVRHPRSGCVIDHCTFSMGSIGVRFGNASGSTDGTQAIANYNHDNAAEHNRCIEYNFWREDGLGIPWWMCKSTPILENGDKYASTSDITAELRYNGNTARWTLMENVAFSARGGGVRNTVRHNTVDGWFNGLSFMGPTGGESRYSTYGCEAYGNRYERIVDDLWELDQTACNVAIWGETGRDALVALSLGPTDFGPVYVFECDLHLGRRGIAKRLTDADNSSLSSVLVKHSGGSSPRLTAYLSNITLYAEEMSVWGAAEVAAPTGSLEEGMDIKNCLYCITGYLVRVDSTQADEYAVDYSVMASNNLQGSTNYGFRWSGTSHNNDLAAFRAASGQMAHGNLIDGVTLAPDDYDGLKAHLRDPDAAVRDLRLKSASYAKFVGTSIPGFTRSVNGRAVRIGFEP